MGKPRVIAHTAGCPGGSCPTTYTHPTPGTSYLQAFEVIDPKSLASAQLRPGDLLVEAPESVIADHVLAGSEPASQPSPTSEAAVRVHGRAVTDPAVLAQFTIPAGEVLVEVSDTDLAEKVTLAGAFGSFRHSGWRLEARDHYVVPEYDAQIRAFQAGQPMPPRADGWEEVVRRAAARGAAIGRTRLVGHPITDYTRWEFTIYLDNLRVGEDVQVVDRAWLDYSWTAAPDVWLFDDRLAFRQLYTDEGVYLGAEQVDAEPVREIRRLLAAHAVPVREFHLADIPTSRQAADRVAVLPPLCA